VYLIYWRRGRSSCLRTRPEVSPFRLRGRATDRDGYLSARRNLSLYLLKTLETCFWYLA